MAARLAMSAAAALGSEGMVSDCQERKEDRRRAMSFGSVKICAWITMQAWMLHLFIAHFLSFYALHFHSCPPRRPPFFPSHPTKPSLTFADACIAWAAPFAAPQAACFMRLAAEVGMD